MLKFPKNKKLIFFIFCLVSIKVEFMSNSKNTVACRLGVSYQYHNDVMIEAPQVGNILSRKLKSDKNTNYYVAVYVGTNTKGIINVCHFQKIIDCYHICDKYGNKVITFEHENSNFHLIMRLSSAGTWITKDMRKQFDWEWLTVLPKDLYSDLRISDQGLFQFEIDKGLESLDSSYEDNDMSSVHNSLSSSPAKILINSLDSSPISDPGENSNNPAQIILTPPSSSWLLEGYQDAMS